MYSLHLDRHCRTELREHRRSAVQLPLELQRTADGIDPCGLADDGMPVSLQIAGKPWLIERLFGASIWCERQLRFADTPRME